MIAVGIAGAGRRVPPLRQRRFGTWIASELTLKPAVLSSTWPEPTPSRSKIAEVDVEALVALTGEHADVAGELLDAAASAP